MVNCDGLVGFAGIEALPRLATFERQLELKAKNWVGGLLTSTTNYFKIVRYVPLDDDLCRHDGHPVVDQTNFGVPVNDRQLLPVAHSIEPIHSDGLGTLEPKPIVSPILKPAGLTKSSR